MNEQELKEIWKNADLQDIPKIDFEKVQKNMLGWHGKLRRKIELDFLSGTLILVIWLVLIILFPTAIYPLPFFLIMYFWYYWILWTIYRGKTKAQDVTSTRKYLEDKAAKLTKLFRGSRIVTSLILYPCILATYYATLSSNRFTSIFVDYEVLSKDRVLLYLALAPYAFLIVAGAVLVIVAIIFNETVMGKYYLPSLDRVKELIEQLDSE